MKVYKALPRGRITAWRVLTEVYGGRRVGQGEEK